MCKYYLVVMGRRDLNQKYLTVLGAFVVFFAIFFVADYVLQAYQGLALFPKGE